MTGARSAGCRDYDLSNVGISGALRRDKRPGFDGMLKDATRRRFNGLMFLSIYRLGHNTAAVAAALVELDAVV
jgi:hypothetical protein